MENKFLQLKREYDNFDNHMLKQGQLPMWDTGVGFYSPAILTEAFDLFKKINLQNYRNFIDLGSGDGRIVLAASLFTNASGIEIDPKLTSISTQMNQRLGLNARFLQHNFLDYNISAHDIIFINPDQPMHRGLETKFLNELKGNLIVYNPHFHPTQLRKKQDFNLNGTFAALYSR